MRDPSQCTRSFFGADLSGKMFPQVSAANLQRIMAAVLGDTASFPRQPAPMAAEKLHVERAALAWTCAHEAERGCKGLPAELLLPGTSPGRTSAQRRVPDEGRMGAWLFQREAVAVGVLGAAREPGAAGEAALAWGAAAREWIGAVQAPGGTAERAQTACLNVVGSSVHVAVNGCTGGDADAAGAACDAEVEHSVFLRRTSTCSGAGERVPRGRSMEREGECLLSVLLRRHAPRAWGLARWLLSALIDPSPPPPLFPY
jgi:hypothetical protein